MDRTRLQNDQVTTRLHQIPGWILADGKLEKTFTFADFRAAFGFMTRCAFWAEKYDHHPDWTNVYNKVTVHLWTHDVSGITEFDFALAAGMNAEAARS